MTAGLAGFWLGLIWFAALLVTFLALGAVGWPGRDDECVQQSACYCERFRVGMVKQPSNTWSNLAFVLVGLLILLSAAGAPAEARNPMTTEPFYAISYGLLVITLGPGSMFFHASMKGWAGILDNLSMFFFVSFVLIYDVFRLIGSESVPGFALVYLAVNAALFALRLSWAGSGKWIFGSLVALTVIIEVLVLANLGNAHREFIPWLLTALLLFGLAVVVWSLSNTGGPLCRPGSWFQGHALWHILTAATTGFVYLYLLTEV